jgi:hypothetical protein
MKVNELIDAAKSGIEIAKQEKAQQIIAHKLLEIERTEKILAKMNTTLQEFLETDTEDIDLCDSRY